MLTTQQMTNPQETLAAESHWYALKVYHSKVFAVEERLREACVECYVPTEEVVVERGGARHKRMRAVIPSLMFMRTDEADAKARVAALRQRGFGVSLYKRTLANGELVPAPIPRREMEMFILVSSSGASGLEYFDETALDLSVGRHVRVTAGIFAGSEGYIKRIKGNRRFVVSINGICAVATPYIPVAFLEPIE